MSGGFDYDSKKESHALRPVIIETRNALPFLAVQIVAAKHDLTAEKPECLIEALYDEIHRLHSAYDTGRLPDL